MSILIEESSGLNPKPTPEELAKAKELIAKGKSKAKVNPAKTPQQAWSKFKTTRNKIRQFVEAQDG